MAEARVEFDLARFRRSYARVRAEVEALAPGVPPRIVIVTKYLDPAASGALASAGFRPFGENRTDDLLAKTAAVESGASWHFIGHLQRNKVSKTLASVELFHALDSERLASSIETWAAPIRERPIACLVEVNLTGEATKGGLTAATVVAVLPGWIQRFPHLELHGLMTMAPDQDPEACRPIFVALRTLRDRVAAELSAAARARFVELSMGMSNDYRVATQEGATLLRLGRILYS